MGELKRKCVILSNKRYKKKMISSDNEKGIDYIYSKLNNIINCSTYKPYLKRINYSEVIRDVNYYNSPKYEITSNLISFNSYFEKYINIEDKNIILEKMESILEILLKLIMLIILK